MVDGITAHICTQHGTVTLAEVRDRFQTSRKYARGPPGPAPPSASRDAAGGRLRFASLPVLFLRLSCSRSGFPGPLIPAGDGVRGMRAAGACVVRAGCDCSFAGE